MVNSKNLLTAGVMSLAVAAIVTYMNVNGLSTEDITLVDACYKASEAKGINTATCDELKQHSMEWDTHVPCVRAFREEVYYWTPRMMFGFYTGGKSEIAELGRKNKGEEEEIVYTAAMNLTYTEALQDRCGPATADEQYPIFLEVYEQMSNGVAVEDLDMSKFENRELYSFNQVAGWIVSMIGAAIAQIYAKTVQSAADNANYRACSVGLALKFASSNLQDRAECSGKHPTRCKRWHSSGPSGWWQNHSRGGNNRLNNGCNSHDKCLEVIPSNWSTSSKKNAGYNCDDALSRAGKRGVQWKWPGISCGWRGCRSWWFAWKYSMSDSRFFSGCVWLSMALHPNG